MVLTTKHGTFFLKSLWVNGIPPPPPPHTHTLTVFLPLVDVGIIKASMNINMSKLSLTRYRWIFLFSNSVIFSNINSVNIWEHGCTVTNSLHNTSLLRATIGALFLLANHNAQYRNLAHFNRKLGKSWETRRKFGDLQQRFPNLQSNQWKFQPN